VDKNLSDDSLKTSTLNNQKSSTKRVKSSPNKRKLLLSSQPQSFDETNPR